MSIAKVVPILTEAGKAILKFLKTKHGKEIMVKGGIIAGQTISDKLNSPKHKASADEIKSKISILDDLLKSGKITQPEYDKRLKKIMDTM